MRYASLLTLTFPVSLDLNHYDYRLPVQTRKNFNICTNFSIFEDFFFFEILKVNEYYVSNQLPHAVIYETWEW